MESPVRDEGVRLHGDTSGVAGQLFEWEDLVRSLKQLSCCCLGFSERARVTITRVAMRCWAEPQASLQKLFELVFAVPHCGSEAALGQDGVWAEEPVLSRIAASSKENEYQLQLSCVVEQHNLGIIECPDASLRLPDLQPEQGYCEVAQLLQRFLQRLIIFSSCESHVRRRKKDKRGGEPVHPTAVVINERVPSREAREGPVGFWQGLEGGADLTAHLPRGDIIVDSLVSRKPSIEAKEKRVSISY